MTDEDAKISLNLELLYPEAARRVQILEELRRSWPGVVGVERARHSMPYNLGVSAISVAVDDVRAVDMLKSVKGNILRALRLRFQYQPRGEFELNITVGVPARRGEVQSSHATNAADIQISEDELTERMSGAPETLPEDINRAITHLKIFLEKLK